MKANLIQIQKSRIFSEDFKREVVALYEGGKFSVLQLSRLYGVSCRSIYVWIYKYSVFNEKGYRVVEKKISSTAKLRELQEQVKELERALGQKQIKIDYLEKMIEIAKTDLNIDIKKNFSTPHSPGSGRTNPK